MINEALVLSLIGRQDHLFSDDIQTFDPELLEIVHQSRFLVVGGAGSIGQAVTKEIFKRNPKALHVVDISENNLVELVRDLRSSLGYIDGDFKTFALDCGGLEYEVMVASQDPYDYILNLSALKHVRSEKDPFTLMRMIGVNIFNTLKTIDLAESSKTKKLFCVSTDKAANPVNMMGASKRIMEMFLMQRSQKLPISTARFANVAFSDGSLLHGFNQRIAKRQPIAAPNDIRRYFVTARESGELCLMSCLLGENRDVFFPKLSEALNLETFSSISVRYLHSLGYEPFECDSEDEARKRIDELVPQKKWPCCFFGSDTTGEKDFEEFFTKNEKLDMDRFHNIGIIKSEMSFCDDQLERFLAELAKMRAAKEWNKQDIVDLFNDILPNFNHSDTGKDLDQKM